jgi:hypothetical protein
MLGAHGVARNSLSHIPCGRAKSWACGTRAPCSQFRQGQLRRCLRQTSAPDVQMSVLGSCSLSWSNLPLEFSLSSGRSRRTNSQLLFLRQTHCTVCTHSCDTLGRLPSGLLVRGDVGVQLLLLAREVALKRGRGRARGLGLGNLCARVLVSTRTAVLTGEARTLMFRTWTSPTSLRTLFLILPTVSASFAAPDAASICGSNSSVSADSAASRIVFSAASVALSIVARSVPVNGSAAGQRQRQR